jgi:AraC family transcriptional regulator, regulatory protein of adaptative response / methylated-DNA-[protein]-cysteine methyltransferase
MKEIISLHDNYKQIEKAIRYLDENFKDHPSIDEVAKNVGMSKFHFIRVFKEYVGVTPKQFLHSDFKLCKRAYKRVQIYFRK